MSDLQDFLDSQADEGSLHSRGVFTVDLARARLKLFQRQFAEPATFLLQLVQAMVRIGCLEIRFFEIRRSLLVGPGGLEMYCRLEGEPTITLDSLRRELLSDPLKMNDSALRDLVSGLGIALSLGEGVGVSYRGSSPWTLLEHPCLRSCSKGPGFVFLFDRFFKDGRESRLIHERCRFSPAPVFWNQTLVAKKAKLWKGEHRLLERIVKGAGICVLVQDLPRVRRRRQAPPLSPAALLYCWQLVDGEEIQVTSSVGTLIRASVALSIPFTLSGPSHLTLIRYGVSLEPVKLHEDFGCQVVVNWDDQLVDLSCFRVREGPLLDGARFEARRELVAAALSAIGELPRSSFLGDRVQRDLFDSSMRAGFAILGVFALFAAPAVGIVMIGKAFWKTKVLRGTDQEEEFLEQSFLGLQSLARISVSSEPAEPSAFGVDPRSKPFSPPP